jgi:hypothetical protein
MKKTMLAVGAVTSDALYVTASDIELLAFMDQKAVDALVAALAK